MLNKMLKVMCKPDSSHEILAQNHELLQRFACGSSLEITHWMVQLTHLRNPTASLFCTAFYAGSFEIPLASTKINGPKLPEVHGTARIGCTICRKPIHWAVTIRPVSTSLVINSWSSGWCTWHSKMDYMFNGNMCFSLNQLLMFSSFPVFFQIPKPTSKSA